MKLKFITDIIESKKKNIVFMMRLEFRLEISNVTHLTEKQIH